MGLNICIQMCIMCVKASVHMFSCTRACMHFICMSVFKFICVCGSENMHLCVHVHTWVHGEGEGKGAEIPGITFSSFRQ